MLPDNLVPAKFHISTVEPKPPEAESNENFTKGKRTLADYAPDILIGVTRTGNSRNMLLEEHDRHIKDRLFRVIKIEVFARLFRQIGAGPFVRPCLLVGALGGERIVDIGHRENARCERNLFARQTVGIARSVKSLMV